MSNETQHTPEPWNTVSDPIMGTLVRQEGLILAKMRKLEGIDHEANAARIVACVNAMDGIDDPSGYIQSARNAVTEGLELYKQVTDLKRTVDIMSSEIFEMLEALEAISDGTAFDKETGLIWSHWLDKIKQVTERVNNGKVEGGQQC